MTGAMRHHGGSVRKVLGVVVHKNVLLRGFPPLCRRQGGEAIPIVCGRGKTVHEPKICWQ